MAPTPRTPRTPAPRTRRRSGSDSQERRPFSRPLRDGVYELRPTLSGEATRITYWFAPDRRIVLLTVFRKTRMRESAQVERAVQARALCEAEHAPAHTTYARGESKETS
ncbi:type II toxin-antitoxin system RelE/ParE family toxin [Streptomyces cyaneofuscatus]|uniref:type II toxin-antitoxin system RelE/ParE family toxin n=1 Tax=Streptomyces cyaneofuscatus TaxID=66883 RepID=UPI0033C0186D